MKWRSETLQQRKVRIKKWHSWFAWHPVRIGKTDHVVWFETVFRKMDENYDNDDIW